MTEADPNEKARFCGLFLGRSVTRQNVHDHAAGDGDQDIVAVDVQPAMVMGRCWQVTCAPVGYPVTVAAIAAVDNVAPFPLSVRHWHSWLRAVARIAIAVIVARFRGLLVTWMLGLMRTPRLAALGRTGLSEAGQWGAYHQRGADHFKRLFHRVFLFL